MDLIERYLNEVGRRLPKSLRDDVRRELSSTLEDELEERGSGNGPSEQDVVDLLQELGHPESVAASYHPAGHYLVGPALYPSFLLVLRISLAALAALLTAAFALTLLAGPDPTGELGIRLGGLLSEIWDVGLTSFAVIVLVFAGLQRVGGLGEERMRPAWDPRQLPAVGDADLAGRGETIFGLVVTALFLVILNTFRDRIGLPVDPGSPVLLNDVFLDNLWRIDAVLLAGMGLSAWLLWSGRWHTATRLARIAIDLFGLHVAWRIAAAVAAQKTTLVAAGLPDAVSSVVTTTAWAIPAVLAAFLVVDVGRVVHRSLQGN